MRPFIQIIALGTVAAGLCLFARAQATELTKTESIVLAGGCFWGMEAVFEHTKGVVKAVSGYTGGSAQTARYEAVSTGRTHHAEAVQVTYDPAHVSLPQLLDIYFTVAHNPTQLNYQGPDHGTQYRSAVFSADSAQRKAAAKKIAAWDGGNALQQPVVTTLETLTAFYPAEDYHQDFATKHPLHPYILAHDAPKVAKLQQTYPALYKE